MKALAWILEGLSAVVGLLVYFLGWPALREVSQALQLLTAILAGLIILCGIVLGVLILISQLAAPYDHSN